ncbi:peptidase [Catellatospora sp. IY07-71]|uniref:S9 family peptidase n=1 Tax=Catellatospora sp. IY07-71 TaxID=2728827 RepID=UPI001BB52D3A|nr:prolyl oligopeptidase family serine peptidase [Catellatospora sp. IY07-71]BCJ74607.1 peptidase [Catellatospora sp. IY07-71]
MSQGTAASYDSLAAGPAGLHWVESVPDAGHSVVATWSPSAGTMLGEPPVGSRVHAYGGGAYAVAGADTWVVREPDGQVWHAGTGRRLTGSPYPHGGLTSGDGLLLGVRETATHDQLVAVDPAGGGEAVLTESPFLGAACLDGGRLAWTRWADGVMPWDASEVWTAEYGRDGLRDAVRVAGGPDESAVQPRWGPDGCLYFLSDRTGWWNLYRHRAGRTAPVAPMAAENAAAPWELDYADYTFLPGGRLAVTAQSGPAYRLVLVEADGAQRPVGLPYTHLKPYLATMGDRVALIGGSPVRTPEIALVATDGTGRVDVVRAGGRPAVDVTVPEVIRVGSGPGQVTALYYPARGAGPAPLIVRPHPGPTHHSAYRLDDDVQFFTGHGFAVADVDYRGSTGYGRAFRKALDGRWGIADVADCRAVAQHLLDTGRARPGAVFVSGASAGGYTALRAVCEDGPFALATARSAIVDPVRWTRTAPRFQRPHAAILAHPDAAVRPSRFTAPVLLVHGTDDPVAPVADVTALAAALAGRGLLQGLVELPGVGHYLTGPARAAALAAELAAYRSVLARAAS